MKNIYKTEMRLSKHSTAEDINQFMLGAVQDIADGTLDLKTAHEISSMLGKVISNKKTQLLAKMFTGDQEGLEFFGAKKRLMGEKKLQTKLLKK